MSTSTHPPITEASILQSYLLNPSPLLQILSYTEFVKTCVPTQHRDHPQIKRLYRDLQFQRDIDVDAVRENIERECRKAGILRGRLAAKIAIEDGIMPAEPSKKRKRTTSIPTGANAAPATDQRDGVPDDEEFNDSKDIHVAETTYHASAHPATLSLATKPDRTKFVPHSSHHTTSSLLDALSKSIASIREENNELDVQNDMLLNDLRETIGQLSDLKYGRFARPASGGGDGEQETFEESVVDALQRLESAANKAVDRME